MLDEISPRKVIRRERCFETTRGPENHRSSIPSLLSSAYQPSMLRRAHAFTPSGLSLHVNETDSPSALGLASARDQPAETESMPS